MARAQRFDLHRLDGPEVLPSGALRVPARVAKVGVLRYRDADGNEWGELVPESTLFAADSMATLRGVAVTDLHPSAPVTAETRRTLQRGHVGDVIARDGDYLSAPVYVTDAEAVSLVQSGQRRDVSCGYECELDETPGLFNGVPYDRVQRDRVYNHLGLGPEGWGRAGTDVALKMDGKGAESVMRLDAGAAVARLDSSVSADTHTPPAAQEPPQSAQKPSPDSHPNGRAAPTATPAKGTETRMAQKTTAKKDGDEMPPKPDEKDKKDMDTKPGDKIDSPDLSAQLDAANNALMEAMKTIAMLKAQLVVAQSAEAPEVTEENVPEMVADSIVAKRLAKLDAARSSARAIAPEVKLDGLMSPRKIHEAALAIAVPTVKLDGLSDDRVAGMVDAFAETAKKAGEKRQDSRQDGKSTRNDALANAHRAAAGEPGEKAEDSVEDAIRKMHQDARDDWKKSAPALRVSTTIKAD